MFQIINKINVTARKTNGLSSTHHVKKGISIYELLDDIQYSQKDDIIAAVCNNIFCDLNEKIFHNANIRFISKKSSTGLQVFRNTAIFILSYVIVKLFGKNILNIGPSIQFNYYFDLQIDKKVTSKLLKKIRGEFDSTVKGDLVIETLILPKDKAVKYFQSSGDVSKAELIKNLTVKNIKFYKIGNYCDICDGPVGIRTGIINKFKFVLYPPGFLIEFPRIVKGRLEILKLAHSRKISKIFLETRDWDKIQGVSDVVQLNDIIRRKKLPEIINISEALHEKRVSIIADKITKNKKDIKMILVAGPSSSGKTTFVKRLSTQLRVNNIKPVAMFLDDYFLNIDDTPKDEDGNYNFDCLEALDVGLFNKHLKELLKGKEIKMPVFNFHKKKREDKRVPLRLGKDEIVIVEGIHGLNEKLTYAVSKKKKFKIYISAVSQLRINYNYRIGTRDTRLIRRIVRDYRFRNNSAYETLKMWPNVRKGEEQNIFPFQEDADIIFNSSLSYETSVLKPMAYKYLKMVPLKSPEYAQARSLMDMLDYFQASSSGDVPKISILREFIGGSSFKY